MSTQPTRAEWTMRGVCAHSGVRHTSVKNVSDRVVNNLSKRLEMLQREPREAVGEVLAGTLAFAAADEIDAIAGALLDNARPEDVAAVIEHRPRVGEPTIERLENGGVSVDSALAAIFARDDGPALIQAMHVVRRRGGARFAEQVAQRLTSGRSDLVDTAAGTLREITIRVLGPHGRARPGTAERERLERAIAAALESWSQHHQDDALVAAALAAVRPGHMLQPIVNDPQDSWGYLLRNVADLHRDPLVRTNLINWLCVPTLAGAVQRRLHEVCDLKRGRTEAADRLARIRRLADVFDQWHLLRGPKRRAGLRQVARPQRCLPDLSLASQSPAWFQALLPELVRALPLPRASRLKWWADMIALPAPSARIYALLQLLSRTGEHAGPAMEPYALDRNRHVASVAVRHVLRRPAEHRAWRDDDPALSRLRRSAHEPIARLTRAVAARHNVNVLCDQLHALNHGQRLAAARMLLGHQRDAFVRMAKDVLQRDEPSKQLIVSSMIAHLGLVDDCVDEITALIDSDCARVAATSVQALARSRSAGRHEILVRALQHADARVRANAIEALETIGEGLDDVLLKPLADSSDNRVRANALGAGIGSSATTSPDAIDGLRSMLTDVKPLHRISALWQVKHRRLTACQPIVETLANDDDRHEIRVRAKRALRFLASRAVNTPGEQNREHDQQHGGASVMPFEGAAR